jgi:hypothetical protein
MSGKGWKPKNRLFRDQSYKAERTQAQQGPTVLWLEGKGESNGLPWYQARYARWSFVVRNQDPPGGWVAIGIFPGAFTLFGVDDGCDRASASDYAAFEAFPTAVVP